MAQAAMTVEEISALMRAGFEGWERTGVTIEKAEHGAARLRLKIGGRSLRVGGTVSGPAMFMIADTALYIAVLASVGPKALAVTTQMSINFLRRPPPADLIADCRLLKVGRRLAFGEVAIFSDGQEAPVAHASGSYAIPQGKEPGSAG
ncbi:MAG: PaaI family thioesterase [Parvularculaceae bacterium]